MSVKNENAAGGESVVLERPAAGGVYASLFKKINLNPVSELSALDKGIVTKSSRRTFACCCQSSAGDASEATDCPLCRNKTGFIKIKKIFKAQVSS